TAVVAPDIGEDGPEPATKAAPGIILELVKALDKHGEDVLHEVVGIGLLQPQASSRVIKERGIELDKACPILCSHCGAAQAFQEAPRGCVHGLPLGPSLPEIPIRGQRVTPPVLWRPTVQKQLYDGRTGDATRHTRPRRRRPSFACRLDTP